MNKMLRWREAVKIFPNCYHFDAPSSDQTMWSSRLHREYIFIARLINPNDKFSCLFSSASFLKIRYFNAQYITIYGMPQYNLAMVIWFLRDKFISLKAPFQLNYFRFQALILCDTLLNHD